MARTGEVKITLTADASQALAETRRLRGAIDQLRRSEARIGRRHWRRRLNDFLAGYCAAVVLVLIDHFA